MADEKQDVDNLEKEDSLVEGGAPEAGAPPPTKEKDSELREALADLTKNVNELAKAKETPQKEEELTQEQKDELWAVFDPEKGRADFMRKFFRMNEDATPEQIAEAKTLFGEMQKGLVKQAVVGARNFHRADMEELRKEFKPVLDYVSRAQAREIRDRFNETYPVFADGKYEKIIRATAKTLDEDKFESEKDYFKALAESAAAAIQDVLPDFDLGAVKTEKKTAGTSPRLPRSSAGGTGGAGGGGKPVVKTTPSGGDIDELE